MELFKLLGTIALDNSEANQALDETAKRAGATSQEVRDSVNKIGSVAMGLGKAMLTAGAAVGGAWIAAIEGSREYRAEMGLLDTAFQASGHSSEAAKNTYSELNAVLGDSGQAVEASQHLALLTDNEKELQTWTDICTGVYATFGESLPIEGLAEAANHTAKVGEVQGSLADALEWSGISIEDFNDKLAKASTEQERQKLIMDTLNGTYSKASDQYKKTNKDVMDARQAQEKLTDALAELGRIGEPILTMIKDKVGDMAAAAIPHIENFVNKVKDLVQWIKTNQDTVHAWVGVIIGAGVAIGSFLLILNWGSIMTAAANAIKTVRLAMLALNTAMLANPVGLIIAVIAGLVAAFVYLWNNVEGFRKFWIDAWNKIKSVASAAGKAISGYFSAAWAAIKNAWDQVKPYFALVWSNIKNIFKVVKAVLSGNFGDAWKAIKAIWNNYKTFFSGIWSGIKKVFASVGSWFGSTFKKAWSSIKSAFSGWGSFFGGLWSQIKSKFGSIGTSIGTAMGNAVKNGLNKVLSTIEKVINKGIGLINNAITLANKLPGINVGKVGKLSLPRLEKGGVLEKGQIGLLEGNGAEAVVPLERNRAWLSQVATDLNELQGMTRPAVDDRIYAMMNQIIVLLGNVANMKVFLESGVLVGELAPAIDRQLSDRWVHSMRGNTR